MIGKVERKVSNGWKNAEKSFQRLETCRNSRFTFMAVALLFLASGMAALLYQVVWTKRLILVFGASGYAVATTLSVFMFGLALGSRVGGGVADRMGRPLLWYALIEAGISFAAFVSVPLLNVLQDAVVGWSVSSEVGIVLFRLAGVFAVLFVPTFLMGMTLPVLVRQCVVMGGRLASRTGWLYGLNMAGGVAGCLLAGFWLIGAAGLYGALMAGVGLNGVVAVLSVVLSFGSRQKFAEDERKPDEQVYDTGTSRSEWFAMGVAFFCAGFASLGVECVWTRMLLFHLNSTAQTFAVMLAVVLCFMSLGSLLGAGAAQRCRHPSARYGLLLLCSGAGMMIALTGWSYLASGKSFGKMSAALFERSAEAWQVPLWDFLLRIIIPSIVLTALPAFLLGYAFPFAAKFFTRQKHVAGRRFGGAYMLNTMGCMLGPLVCGFVLLPRMGMQGALLVCVVLLVAAGCLVRVNTKTMTWRQGVAVPMVFAVLALLLPERVLFSLFSDGVAFYDDAVLEQQGVVLGYEGANRMIFHEEDMCGSVLVMEQEVPGIDMKLRRLYVGPTSMVTDNFAAQRYTRLIGHLPALLAGDPKRALVICLGTGMTLSGVAAHENIEQIDCAELSPAVTRAVHCYDHVNGKVLDDSRVRLIVNDGRTHLMRVKEWYDVIALEPPPPDNEGAANLYSQEFYALCSERLSEKGVIAQWIPYHLLTAEQIRSLMAAMLNVFPEVTLWEIYPGMEFCLIGHKADGPVDYGQISERMTQERVLASLEGVGIRGAPDVMSCFVAGTAGVRELVGDAVVVTDDRPVVGYGLENLGLLTEYDPQGHAMRNSLETLQYKQELEGCVDFGGDEDLNRFIEEYIKVRGAVLMDRKLAVVACLGVRDFMTRFEEKQLLLVPAEMDPDNPLYRTRTRVAMYIKACNRLAAYYEQKRELRQAMQYRMMVGRLKNLLPENYFQGRHYKKHTRVNS